MNSFWFEELLDAAYDRVCRARRGTMARRGDRLAVTAAQGAYFELRAAIERYERDAIVGIAETSAPLLDVHVTAWRVGAVDREDVSR